MLQCMFNYLYRNRRKWRKNITGLIIFGVVIILLVYVVNLANFHQQAARGKEKFFKDINKKIKYLKKNIDDIEYIRGIYIKILIKRKYMETWV